MFRLHVSTDPKIIDAKDGSAMVVAETHTLELYKNIPEFSSVLITESLDCFKLLGKAQIVDVFSCGNSYYTTGIIVSEKVKVIMQEHNICSVQFLPCIIHDKKENLTGFYLLHIYSYLLDKIDYNRTSFSRIWPFPREVEETYGFIDENKLKSEIMKYAGSVSFIEPDTGYVFRGFDYSNFDLFRIGYIDDFIYISSRLKSALAESGVIGFEYTSVTKLFS